MIELMKEGHTLAWTFGICIISIVAFMAYGLIGGFISFLLEQGKALLYLYRNPTQELDSIAKTFKNLHPYTQAILANDCPELEELRNLKGDGLDQEAQEVLDGMIYALKKERNLKVKNQIIRQLRCAIR